MAEPTEVWAVIASDGFVLGAFGNRDDAEKHAKYCAQLKQLATPCTYCRYVVPAQSAPPDGDGGWVPLAECPPRPGTYAILWPERAERPVLHRVEGEWRGEEGALVFHLPPPPATDAKGRE